MISLLTETLAGLPDAAVTVTDSGCIIAKVGDTAFYVTAK